MPRQLGRPDLTPRPALLRPRAVRIGSRLFLFLCFVCSAACAVDRVATSPENETGNQQSLQRLTLTLRDRFVPPSRTPDQFGREFTIAGLSGITWLGNDEFIAAMDNSDKLVRMKITFDGSGRFASFNVVGGVTLEHKRDFEGIASDPLDREVVWISDEGRHTAPPAADDALPRITAYRIDSGRAIDSLALLPEWAYRRINLGLESLTINSAGNSLWTANEEALTIDGPTASSSSGTIVRLFRFARSGSGFLPDGQFRYTTEPVHVGSNDNARRYSGVCDLITLDDGRLIVLERSFGFRGLLPSMLSRIFLFTPEDSPCGRASKTLLWSGPTENMEGLCMGPTRPDGSRLILGVSDNNGRLDNAFYVFVLRSVKK